MDFIYDNYIYFTTIDNAGTNTFKMKTDGSEIEELDILGFTIGASNSNILFYGNSVQIKKMNCYTTDVESVYNDANFNIRADATFFDIVNNVEYIIFVYKLYNNEEYNICILDINGVEINRIKIKELDTITDITYGTIIFF